MRRLWLFSLVAVFAGLTLMMTAGCGTSSPSPSPSPPSGVRGEVVGVRDSHSPEPIADFPLLIHAGGFDGSIVARVRTGPLGEFAADLSPGRYTVGPAVISTMGPGSETFTVAPGRYASVKLIANAP